jgi:ATP-dependent Lhr-like helicase
MSKRTTDGLAAARARGNRRESMPNMLLGADPPPGVVQSRRATEGLDDLRKHHSGHVTEDGTVLRRSGNGDVHWCTWAGSAVNRAAS